MVRSVIVGTGSYIPEVVVTNDSFGNHNFYEKDGEKLSRTTASVVEKFSQITGILERRYARPDQQASDLGFLAAQDAILSSRIDRESLDYIIVAHNFGDIKSGSNRSSMVPSLASRVKALLEIKNPSCVAYDLPFGCPGWVEGMLQANSFIRVGDATRCLVIGCETLSRIIDPHDRDSMIYSDGAGAVIIERKDADVGMLSWKSETHAVEYAGLLSMGHSYHDNAITNKEDLFIKMNGRKVYEFALSQVPLLIKSVIDKAGVGISDVKKILVHQANDKMDAAIVARLFKLYGVDSVPEGITPMTISWLGNSSVATVPTLLDLIVKNKFEGQNIHAGDKVIFASVGAGMNINAFLYQF
jgi:3-oxoacyl-[acyl-carrier-protein] synthase III